MHLLWCSQHSRSHVTLSFLPQDLRNTSPMHAMNCCRCQMYTGHVTAGGSICLEALTTTGTPGSWQSTMSVISLLNVIVMNWIDCEEVGPMPICSVLLHACMPACADTKPWPCHLLWCSQHSRSHVTLSFLPQDLRNRTNAYLQCSIGPSVWQFIVSVSGQHASRHSHQLYWS